MVWVHISYLDIWTLTANATRERRPTSSWKFVESSLGGGGGYSRPQPLTGRLKKPESRALKYTYTYVYLYLYLYQHQYLYLYLCHISISISKRISIYMYMYIMRVYIYVYTSIYIYVYIYMNIHLRPRLATSKACCSEVLEQVLPALQEQERSGGHGLRVSK